MSHQTGLILMDMLANAKRPLSFEDILDQIEQTVGKPVDQLLIEAIMETLENGVKLGFLHRNGANYCIKPMHIRYDPQLGRQAFYMVTHDQKRQSRQTRRRGKSSKLVGSDDLYTFRRNRSRSRVPPRSKPCTRCSSRRNTQNQRCSRCM